MSGQFCPDCEMGSMKAASGPGRRPSRCAMCGWVGDLDEVPFESRVDDESDPDPTVCLTVRIARGREEAEAARVWDAVSKIVGDTGTACGSLRSRHRTFLVPRDANPGPRILAVEGVVRLVEGDSLWSRWLAHDVHFLRVRVNPAARRQESMEAAIMDIVVPDVERGSWAQNGDYVLRMMDPPLPAQVAGLEAIDGVEKAIVIDPAGEGR